MQFHRALKLRVSLPSAWSAKCTTVLGEDLASRNLLAINSNNDFVW